MHRATEIWVRCVVLAAGAALPLLAGAASCKQPVYLTFDTGHMDVAPLVAEVLQRHQVRVSPRVLGLRVDESLYFANSRVLEDRINEAVAAHPELAHVVLQCSAVNDIDASALESLESINHRLKDAGLQFHLSEVKGPVMDRLQRSDFLAHLTGRVFLTHHQAVTALIAGDVHFACLPPVAVMPQVKAGRLKALAVTSAQRFDLLPELPTLRESGIPDIQAEPWFAYMAPQGTPPNVVQRMSREIAAVLKDPETRQRLQGAYFNPVGSTPQELNKFMNDELARWKPVILRAGLKPEN